MVYYIFFKTLQRNYTVPHVMAYGMAALGQMSSFRALHCVRSPWTRSGCLENRGLSHPEEHGCFGTAEVGIKHSMRGSPNLERLLLDGASRLSELQVHGFHHGYPEVALGITFSFLLSLGLMNKCLPTEVNILLETSQAALMQQEG